MKLGKATIYYFDIEGDDPTDNLKQTLTSRDWVSYDLFNIEEVEIGEWYDDIRLNKESCTQDDYESYFRIDMKTIVDMCKAVVEIYKTKDYTGINLNKAKEYVFEKHRKLTPAEIDIFEQQLGRMLP